MPLASVKKEGESLLRIIAPCSNLALNRLARIGRFLRNNFKGMDIVGRIGGDEFMAFVRNIKDAEAAMHIANGVIEQALELFPPNDYDGRISLSIGIALFPQAGIDLDSLYKAADEALYYVKEHGRGAARVFDTK